MNLGKKKVSLVLMVIVIASLSAWTVLSPRYMIPQSSSALYGSLFRYASENQTIVLSDAEGSYTFLVGMSYNGNASNGQLIIVDVFCSLISHHFYSGFMRGVGLHFVSASVLIDGVQIQPIQVRMTFRPSILIVYLASIKIDQNLGNHSLTARLIVSTVDANYLGYFNGPQQVITLSGMIQVV